MERIIPDPMSREKRKVALVTGGGRRIGAAISRRLSREGFLVALTYLDARAEAVSLADEIGGIAFPLDLARSGTFPRFARAIEEKFGRLDLIVHNAAIFPRTPMDSITGRDWDRVFDVNLRGPFLLTGRLLPLMLKTRGSSVLFIGDAGAGLLWPSYLPYCISKLALEAQAKAWRKTLSPRIQVGVVRPGLALIPPGFPKKSWDRLRARESVRRLDSPAKVAGAVLRFARGGEYNFSRS
jgi:pteridine reductase